jgi:hypothetical protein
LEILRIARYYGPYSSRTKGKANKDGSLAKFRCNAAPKKKPSRVHETETISNTASRLSWARLIKKVFEVDPLVCPKSGSKMKGVAVITDPCECKHSLEVNKILECLKRNNAPPFEKDALMAP